MAVLAVWADNLSSASPLKPFQFEIDGQEKPERNSVVLYMLMNSTVFKYVNFLVEFVVSHLSSK